MRYDLTVITPTCDRPVGIELAERWMKRQTYGGRVQWIVSDDGSTSAKLTMGQVHVRREREPEDTGALSLGKNLLAAFERVEGRYVAIWEDDDLYKPHHLADLCRRLDHGYVAAGDEKQRYYNVRFRLWRLFNNRGASLCQTAFRSSLIDKLSAVIYGNMMRNSYGFDTTFWSELLESDLSVDVFDGDAGGHANCVGIKSLPGLKGNGVGHRPDPATWYRDEDAHKLREWCGDDAPVYERFWKELAA